MSSPITISSSRTQTQTAATARSFDSATSSRTGLYVPVHRRNPSASAATSAPSSYHDRASLPPPSPRSAPHSKSPSRSPAVRPRSVSPLPAPTCRDDVPRSPKSPATPLAPRTHANIPPASKIPRVYALTELLALAYAPSAGLSPTQRALVDAHIPLMTRKAAPTKAAPTKAAPTKAAPTKAAPSPSSAAKPLDDQIQIPNWGKATDAQRRRRSGRKAPNASLKLPRVPADVDRRRRGAYGAGWGRPAAPHDGSRNVLGLKSQNQTWRAERFVAAA